MSPEPDTLRCPACDTPLLDHPAVRGGDRLHGSRGVFEVVICGSCGTGTTLPRATAARLAAFYPAEYGAYDPAGGGLVGAISRTIRWYQGRRALVSAPLSAIRGVPSGRLVDVGCGRGDLAAVFVERGWKAVGVEPSEAACAAARLRGVEARVGTLEQITLEASLYDAAIFHHSLEHTPDPAGDLKKVGSALRPGGLALLTVPNFGSWQRLRFHDRWYHLDLPRHRTHFTETGLRSVLDRAGLKVESVTTSSSSVGLPATLQYTLVGRCLFPRGLGLRVASGLCVLALPVARVLDALRGGGDQLHAVARRPPDA